MIETSIYDLKIMVIVLWTATFFAEAFANFIDRRIKNVSECWSITLVSNWTIDSEWDFHETKKNNS